jgi:hypothetical protein
LSIHQSRLFCHYSATFCSELVSLPRNGSERHFESLFIFFVARKGIPSWVLFRGMVRNGIPRICIYFGSTERNSELCSLPQKGSEQSSGSLLPRNNRIPWEITICSVYSVFAELFFCRKFPTLSRIAETRATSGTLVKIGKPTASETSTTTGAASKKWLIYRQCSPELVQHFAYRGSPYRRKGAARHLIDDVSWLGHFAHLSHSRNP